MVSLFLCNLHSLMIRRIAALQTHILAVILALSGLLVIGAMLAKTIANLVEPGAHLKMMKTLNGVLFM